MTGELYIDNIDIYSQFGVWITEGGYDGLLSFPDLREPEKNEWAEEDGIEVDLEELFLRAREVTISFVASNPGIDAKEFINFLCQPGYRKFRIPILGREWELRMTKQASNEIYTGLSAFSLTFADDFPPILVSYQANGGGVYIPGSDFEMDGIALERYGIVAESGRDDLLKSPAIRQGLTRNVSTMDGQIYDIDGKIHFKEKDVTFKCRLIADSIERFWQCYEAFFINLVKPNERRLTYSETGLSYKCYYKKTANWKIIQLSGRVVVEFSLTLVFTSFRPGKVEYLLATEDNAFVNTEDDHFVDMSLIRPAINRLRSFPAPASSEPEAEESNTELRKRKITEMPETGSLDGLYVPAVDSSNRNVRIAATTLKGEKGDPGEESSGGASRLSDLKDVNREVDAAPEGSVLSKKSGKWTAIGSSSFKGDKGDAGDKGDKGDKGDTGSKGDKGDPGTSEGSVVLLSYEAYTALTKKDNGILYACLEGGKITRSFVGIYPFLCSSGESVVGYTVTVGVNPSNVPHVSRIEAAGDVIDTKVSATKDSYVFTVTSGGNCTIKIVPAEGHSVEKLNVDTINQGAVNTYTFTDIQKNHTAYVWMREVPVINNLTYKRSDIDTDFSDIESAVHSVLADFPEGLPYDLTIQCTQEGIDKRGTGKYSFEMKRWNQDSPYVLTLDGNLASTLDGRGFGGMYIEECSNIIIRNFTFQNFATYENFYAPEETACVYVTNVSKAKPCGNIYIENCTVNGQSTLSPGTTYRTRFAFSAKGYDNVSIVNCDIKDVSVKLLSFNNVKMANIIKTKMSGIMQSGIVGHPYMMEFMGCTEVNLEDCDINASSFNEPAIYVSNIYNINIKRNKIYNSKGPVLFCTSLSKINSVCIDYNYMYDNMMYPLYSWDCNWFSIANAGSLVISNNLVVFSSTYYQEFFLRSSESNYDKIVSVDNIFIRKNNQNHGILLIGDATEKIIKNNLYKLEATLFFSAQGISSSTGRNLDELKKIGLEENSGKVSSNTPILISETGGSRNCLTPIFAEQYKSGIDYVGEFDLTYKKNIPANTSIGCENYYAQAFDEVGDNTTGYEGIDITDNVTFSGNKQYAVPADNVMLLRHLTKKRDKFIKFTIQASSDANDKKILLGKYTILSLLPNVDNNGEYVSAKSYNIKID